MLLNFLRKSFPIQYAVLVLLVGIVWSFSFFLASDKYIIEFSQTTIFPILGKWVISYPFITKLAAIILLLVQAYFFNYILIDSNIISKNSIIGIFTYSIFMSFNISFNYLAPTLIANTFILIVLYQIFSIYQNPEEYQIIFNVGFMISIASFFYFPAIYLIFFVWISFLLFRMVNWRPWTIVFFGLLTPYLFFFVYLYWNNTFQNQLSEFVVYFSQLFEIDFNLGFGLSEIAIYAGGMLFIIFSFVYIMLSFFEQSIFLRRNLSAVIALLLTQRK